MMKVNKHLPRGKAISSYFLSGINIKKLICDQLQTDLSEVADASIVRVSKRPIFRIKSREAQKQNASELSGLPSKSFKIRSFTKKLRDQSAIKLMESSDDIFDKIQNVRNFKSISNRVDLISRIKDRQQPTCVARETSTKMKEVLRVEAALKCKLSSKIFIRQVITPRSYEPVAIEFARFDVERYRELANRINVSFNEGYKEDYGKKTLLIVSMQVLQVSSRRWIKGSSQDERPVIANNFQKAQRTGVLLGREQIELIKMLTQKEGMNMRVVFKVDSSSDLQQWKSVLQRNKIDRYYCLFYPIKKYSEKWGLYQIDPFLNNSTQIIIMEERHKIHEEFPIVGPDCQVAFVTAIDSIFSVSRAIAAVKLIDFRQKKKEMLYLSPLIEDLEQADDLTVQSQKKISTICEDRRKVRLHQQSQMVTDESKPLQARPQFEVKSYCIAIDLRQLRAKLNFVEQNKRLKSCFRKSELKEGVFKRRVLYQQQQNTFPSSRQVIDKVIDLYKNEERAEKGEANRMKNLEEIRQALTSALLNEELTVISHASAYEKSKRIEGCQRTDDLEQLSNYARGNVKAKNGMQLISELLKRNQQIYNQITSYYQKTQPLRQMGLNMEVQTHEQTESLQMKIHLFV